MAYSHNDEISRRTAMRLLGAAGLGAATAGSVTAQSDGSETIELKLLHDTHVHGRLGNADESENIENYFGLMDSLTTNPDNTLRLGAGDDLGSSALSTEFEGKHIVDAFEAGDLSQCTFGNHDFDFGPDVLKTRVSETEGFQWVTANVRKQETGETFATAEGVKRFDTVDIGGITVGVTGILTERASEVTSLGSANEVIQPTDALSEVVPEMQSAGADVIIVLSHVANDAARNIAERVDGIDVMVGDDAAEVLGDEVVNDTILSFVGDGYDHLGEITLQMNSNGVSTHEYTLHTVSDAVSAMDITPNAAVQETATTYRNQVDRTPIGETTTQLNCITANLRTEETNMGSFVADAIRTNLGSDVVIQNGGGIRTGTLYAAGEITNLLIKQILPFGNTMIEIEVTGATIREALENGVSDYETLEGRFPQVSGMSYEWNPDAPEGERIVSVDIAGSPLDPETTYTLGTNNFMADGGDGYEMLPGATVTQEGAGIAEAVIEYIKQQTPISPTTEGRITRVSTFQSGTVLEEYDSDDNGSIEIDELADAGEGFANGELSITDLGELGRVFSS
uniref:2'3'-cyclic-nucleotide 2'-phosphodiesterase n=1 Tax=uncultured haloarchaeon TaxID=160804 RepID=A0A0K1YAY2_9EURY|nr:2'3'-cyclic-nucleotide 2'-phosphodiesterase [uncultured haloarchaeon]